MAEVAGSMFNQYSTVKPLFRGLPTWVSGDDADRIQSYLTYENIYWNIPHAFRVVQRGDDADPVYIPSARQIVETLHRFMANDIDIISDPEEGSDVARTEADRFLKNMFRRERFISEFNANKRFGIIRGDWLFHIYADPDREADSRISLVSIDPASYFPIENEDNLDEIIGVHLVEPFEDDSGDLLMRRLTYRKQTERGGPSPIVRTDEMYEIDAWGGPEMDEKKVRELQPEAVLPSPIDQIPVYHIINFQEPQNPWGSSELRGFESLIGKINQAASDEDVALALEGLGVYVTDSGPPEDDTGQELPWRVAPGYVIEIGESKNFDRVRGVDTLKPYTDHLKYLHNQLDLGSGTPAVAKGEVEVTVAESGIALAIRFGPLLARAMEKEHIVTSVTSNMLYDLRKWIQAYEPHMGRTVDEVRWVPAFGEKIPQNRKEKFKELMEMLKINPPLVSRVWVREQLKELGYEFPEDTEFIEEMIEERQIFGRIDADVEGFRIDEEINRLDGRGNGQTDEEGAEA